MDKVRKLAERVWYNKERIVFVIMLGVLCWHVYRVRYPAEVPPETPYSEPSRVQETDAMAQSAGLPPRQMADWVGIYTPNPFWYFSGLAAAANQPKEVVDAGIKLLRIKQVKDKYRAQLQTESSTKWYDEGESFESFEILKIDPEAGTCQVRSERLGRVITLSLPGR